MTNRFSIGDVLNPMQEMIVKGFHKYTRAAISPDGRISSFQNSNLISPGGISKQENQKYPYDGKKTELRRQKGLILLTYVFE